MRFFHQEPYSFLWRFGLWWPTQQPLDLRQYLVDYSLVNIKPRGQFFFQFCKFACKAPLLNKHLPHTNERAHYKNTHLNGPLAAQDVGCHECPVLSEGVRRKTWITVPL